MEIGFKYAQVAEFATCQMAVNNFRYNGPIDCLAHWILSYLRFSLLIRIYIQHRREFGIEPRDDEGRGCSTQNRDLDRLLYPIEIRVERKKSQSEQRRSTGLIRIVEIKIEADVVIEQAIVTLHW